ncbi:arylsulfatase [Shivajiella indica]|uniref:Arylsulfatase n=1 Tax=Shivajiella indica TaxID=872115 RepID=A0ABW5BEN0_9BACT
MNKNHLSLIFYIFFWVSCQEKVQERPLNVLLVITDDQGWGDLSYNGNPYVSTPNIDNLADSSVVFDRFYVSPVCAPTRASLLTGRYHLATGTTWVTHRMEVMREEELTIAELLKAEGYKTGLFGKWHQGKQFPHDPIGQGFDEFFGYSEGHINNYFDTKLTHNFSEVQTTGYLPDVLTDKAIAFMKSEEPFFTMVSYNTPHSPFQVPDRYFDKYKSMELPNKEACIYGMVENLDENIGRLIDFLNSTGKMNNTIVIFMTDNGPNGIRYNGGMKGIKGHIDEGGVRVPFFIKIPGVEGKKLEPWAGHIDILPTLADFLGIALPENVDIHGKSLKPLINGDSLWIDRYFFTHQVVRDFDTIPGAVRNQEFLLTIKGNEKALFNLLEDPEQKTNILSEFEGTAEDLEGRYQSWFKEMTKKGINPPLIQVGHHVVPTVCLPAPDGELFGQVHFKGVMGWANDWVLGFDSADDKVSWEMLVVEDTNYDIFVEMVNVKPLGMKVEMNGESMIIQVDKKNEGKEVPSLDKVPRSEVYEKEWPWVPVGKKRFEKGKVLLSLSLEHGFDSGLEIKSIILQK